MEARVFPFPVLSEASICYLDRVSYQVDVGRNKQGGDIIVEHRLSGDNLVASLVNDGRAKFACVVSMPLTMFRKVYPLDGGGELVAIQRIPCDEGELSGTPMLRPVVVCAKSIPPVLAVDSHGLDPFYAGEHIRFLDGAIIADAGWQDFRGHGDILRIRRDDKLELGTFKVTISETDGFYFVVNAAPGLFEFLQNPNGRGDYCMSIMTNAFSIGLSQLRSTQVLRENWQNYQSLQVLYRDIEERGLKTWDDDEFSPELVATTIHPHLRFFEDDSDDD